MKIVEVLKEQKWIGEWGYPCRNTRNRRYKNNVKKEGLGIANMKVGDYKIFKINEENKEVSINQIRNLALYAGMAENIYLKVEVAKDGNGKQIGWKLRHDGYR